MSLNNPQSRIAFGNVIQAIIVLMLVGLVAWLIKLLSQSAHHLFGIAMALCVIIGLFVAGVVAENVGRVAVKAGKDGVDADIGNDPPVGGNNGQ